MALTTTYSATMPASFVGALVDTAERGLLTRVAEVDGIVAGMPLMAGTLADDNVLPFAAGGVFEGVCVRTHSINGTEWARGEHIRMLRHDGAIWVEPDVAVVRGEQVHVIPGGFSNTGGDPIDAYWESTTAAGALGKFRFR